MMIILTTYDGENHAKESIVMIMIINNLRFSSFFSHCYIPPIELQYLYCVAVQHENNIYVWKRNSSEKLPGGISKLRFLNVRIMNVETNDEDKGGLDT